MPKTLIKEASHLDYLLRITFKYRIQYTRTKHLQVNY